MVFDQNVSNMEGRRYYQENNLTNIKMWWFRIWVPYFSLFKIKYM